MVVIAELQRGNLFRGVARTGRGSVATILSQGGAPTPPRPEEPLAARNPMSAALSLRATVTLLDSSGIVEVRLELFKDDLGHSSRHG